MNTRALALAAALIGASLGACTGVNESAPLSLAAICAPTDDCTFAETCGAQYIGTVAYDRTYADDLWLPVQVNNRLLNNEDKEAGRVNSNDAHITRFEITYQGFPLAADAVEVNQLVPAGGSSTVGLYVVKPGAIAPVALPTPIPPPTQAIARVVAKGYYDHGATFETGEFPVAFTLCYGCVGVPVTCTAPAFPVITCGSVGTEPVKAACQTP